MKRQKPRRTPEQSLVLLEEEVTFYKTRTDLPREEAEAAEAFCAESLKTIQKAAALAPGLFALDQSWRIDRFTASLALQGALA